MKRITSCYCYFVLPILISILVLLSGCVMNKGKETASLLVQKNIELERANEELVKELEQQKQLTAQLQMSLLEKYAEVDRLTATQERFAREFVHNKTKLWNRGDKVETVKFVAEVTTVIDTVRERKPKGSRKDALLRAEQYLAESKTALDDGNFDDASYLAEQALKQVQTKMDVGDDGQLKEDLGVTFAAPLSMKLLKSSNVRETPSMQAKVKCVLETGSQLIAVGYKGEWVKVKIAEEDNGWIHYSLLSGVWE